MEARGKLGDKLVDAAGVIVAGGEAYLLRKRRKLLYKLALLRSREPRDVHVLRGRHLMPLLAQRREHGAYPCVRVLHIVHGVFAVLPHGEVKVKLHRRLGTGIEEVARRVHGYLVEQIRQRYRLAGTL